MMLRYIVVGWLGLLLLTTCTYTLKIQDGTTAVDRKQYAVAVPMLRKEFSRAKSRVIKGRLAYLLGQSYDQLNQPDEALEWYRTAYTNGYGVDALRDQALMLKKAGRYDEAIEAFTELGLEIGSPYEYRREISGAEVAKVWLAEQRPEYRVESLDFNSGSADYAPVPYRQQQLIITSDRPSSQGDETYNWTGQAFADLFVVDLASGQVSGFSEVINTEANEGTPAFSSDYSEVIFTRCADNKYEAGYCQLMSSQVAADGSWSAPVVLGFVAPGVNYMHPALSADGNTLYFSSDHTDGWGGYDIYTTTRLPDGNWELPQLMSRAVNTSADEQFPYLDADTLYFASSGHTGMGGLDIFRTYQLRGNWTPAYNLKPPINSSADDFGLVMDRTVAPTDAVLAVGYFSSNRLEGSGGDDIYRYERIVPPPLPPNPEPIVYRNILDVYVLEKIYEDPTNPNSKVLGRRPLTGAQLTISIGRAERAVEIGADGLVSLPLSDDTDYSFLATATGFLNEQSRFSSRGLGQDPARPEQRYELEMVLDKIFVNREIVLENIYYDFDESFIRDDAKPTLDELSRLLTLNPTVQIELGSHTDCRGNTQYNEELSRRRAQAAVDYLITSGIDATRLRARGYGESQPAVDCVCSRCTEAEYQANRRTTFTILQ